MADTVQEFVFNLTFPFTRTLGSTLSTFSSALAQGQIIGVRTGGRVIAPPLEYDPDTSADSGTDWVRVGPKGTVSTWTWVPEPTNLHPLDHAFGFAFITLDGADTPMIHLVDAGSESAMSAGMRVEAKFKAPGDCVGRIDDIIAFVPAADPSLSEGAGEPFEAPEENDITEMDSYCDLTYVDNASPTTTMWAKALMEGRLIGQKCPQCERTIVGPRGMCSVCAIELDESHVIDVADRGVVSNFTIVTPVQYHGQTETEPFVRCSIMLDGANAVIAQQEILDIPASEVHVGMHVECVWAPVGERSVEDIDNRSRGSGGDAIIGWRLTGEPDEPAELYLDRMM
ncbi:MAG: OB-fold domain-containing protein [Actinomycetes bacterium]